MKPHLPVPTAISRNQTHLKTTHARVSRECARATARPLAPQPLTERPVAWSESTPKTKQSQDKAEANMTQRQRKNCKHESKTRHRRGKDEVPQPFPETKRISKRRTRESRESARELLRDRSPHNPSQSVPLPGSKARQRRGKAKIKPKQI